MHNPLPSTPGAFLGYDKNGKPIRLIAGASEQPETPPGDPAPPPETPPAAPPAGEQPPASPEPGTGQEPTPATGDDPEKTARTVAAIREDYKAERAKRQAIEKKLADIETASTQRAEAETARNKALAIALGITQEEVTPEELAERAQQERDTAKAERDTAAAAKRAADVELAVLRAAYASGVNGNALLDSRAFVATVTGLDPADDDFAAGVKDAIAAAVGANPAYNVAAATQVAAAAPLAPAAPVATIPRSGGEFNGSPGGNRQWNLDDVNNASALEVEAAINQGLLADLGHGPAKKKRN